MRRFAFSVLLSSTLLAAIFLSVHRSAGSPARAGQNASPAGAEQEDRARAVPPGAVLLKPRIPAQKVATDVFPPETPVERIVLKLREGSRARLRNGRLTLLPRSARERSDLAAEGLRTSVVRQDVLALRELLESDARVVGVSRLFDGLTEAFLARWKASGEAASGQQLADLDLYYEVRVPPGTRFAGIESLLALLNGFPSVEIAYADSPPIPASGLQSISAAAVTPNYQSQQGYLNAAPQGIDALYAWTVAGGRGANVKVVDMEYAWTITHEDFPALFHYDPPGGVTEGQRGHGTAAVGIMAAKANGFGVTGIVPDAQIGLQSHWNSHAGTVSAKGTALAAAAAGPGGVVLLELATNPLHSPFPKPAPCCPGWEGACGSLPLESQQADFDAIRTATANGTTIVEPAGNGSAGLDSAVYGGIFSRAVRDSGAILVGARDSVTGEPACFTNWGSRLDVSAWGNRVVTLGCGDACGDLYGSTETSWYTNTFDGTSSASPMVAAAAASLQGASKANRGLVLSPAEIRQRLMSNATWVYNFKNIGPMPNLRGAMGQLLNGNRVPTAVGDTFTTPRNAPRSIFFYQLLANDSDPNGETLYVDAYDLQTQHGSNDIGHAGGFNYTPAAGFVGTDMFSYRIVDARGLVAFGKVTIQVQ